MSEEGYVARLRTLIAPRSDGRRTLLSVPGCWDPLTGFLAEQAGFECVFLSGGALSMARLGRPDLGLVTASELVETVALIRERISVPLIVDADTGFGNAFNCQRTVRALERAGATAIQIEDQRFPKRCGHMAGKLVVSIDEAVGRLRAALDSRDSALIIARTDAAAVEGMNAALERAQAFADAGADLLFIEGPPTLADMQQISLRFGAYPLVHNLVEGGVSAVDTGAELEAMGFAIALHPLILLHGLVRQGEGWLSYLRNERSTVGLRSQLGTLQDMHRLLGAEALLQQAQEYGS